MVLELAQIMGDPNIAIIDYGLGNLGSVQRAFRKLDRDSEIIDSPGLIDDADYLVLPGVGAFEDGMNGLKKRDLVGAISDYAAAGRPLLGICLGMQLFMSRSEEFGDHRGLDLIPGEVLPLKPPSEVGLAGYKVPLIGWNEIYFVRNKEDSIFRQVEQESNMYFVHSFFVEPENRADSVAVTRYGGQEFCAAIQRGSVIGCQFHPEKSGELGLSILAEFISGGTT